jgi:hypothetical protein
VLRWKLNETEHRVFFIDLSVRLQKCNDAVFDLIELVDDRTRRRYSVWMDKPARLQQRLDGRSAVLIEVQIDDQGRMLDCSVLEGQMNSDVGNFLLFTTYTAFEDRAISSRPAALFLQPASSRIVIRRSRIVVKG